jgi:hypothetical protein
LEREGWDEEIPRVKMVDPADEGGPPSAGGILFSICAPEPKKGVFLTPLGLIVGMEKKLLIFYGNSDFYPHRSHRIIYSFYPIPRRREGYTLNKGGPDKSF